MPITLQDGAATWDVHTASKAASSRLTNAAGARTWFNATQYPDHGPDETLLGDVAGARVLELGCGTGRNAAHLAQLGAHVDAVDLSPRALTAARQRWADVPDVRWHQADAVDYLTAEGEPYDVIYSVFGAIWFTDPEVLLPLVAKRLAPGGRLLFSQEPPIEGCYGCQGSYVRPAGGGRLIPVRRWAYTPGMWRDLLGAYGFREILAEEVAGPTPADVPTLLVRAVR